MHIIEEMDELKLSAIDVNAVLIIDNPSHIFNYQPKVKNLVMKKMMKTILIASNLQIEQIKDRDLDLIDALIYSNCSFHDLDEALNNIMSGLKYRCKRLENVFNTESISSEKLNLISQREIEIIKLVINGKTSSEIAEQLNISYHTVATHRKNINKKLDIKTAHDLTRMFLNVNFRG